MKKKKQTPIIYGTRVMWARYVHIHTRTGRKQTRLVQLWERYDGTTRLYLGVHRMADVFTFRLVCEILELYGWQLVAGGC